MHHCVRKRCAAGLSYPEQHTEARPRWQGPANMSLYISMLLASRKPAPCNKLKRWEGAQQASPKRVCEHPAGQLAEVFRAGMSHVQHIPPVQSVVCPTELLTGAAAARTVLLLEPGCDLLHAGQLPPPGASSCLCLGRGRLLGARNVCLEFSSPQLGCALFSQICIRILALLLLGRGLL